MLRFENVSRVYDDGTRAVDDVSLHIRSGEFCVLLGPSGAGKSTLMNMVNGVVEPSSGNVKLGDLRHMTGKGNGNQRPSSSPT